MAEISSPSSRGRAMGLLNSFYYVGQILASGLAVPLGRKAGNIAWRVPLWIQVGFPAINIACVMLLPESPRWLYSRGHTERARQVLANLHSRDRDINSPLINFEIEEIEEALETASADKNWWDFRKIFARGHRYRIGLAFMVSVYGQLSGNGLITYFLTILLAQAGIKDQNKILTLNFVNSVTSFAGALTGTAIVDKVGRRKLMLFACCCCCVGMFIVGGLLSPAGTQTVGRANAGIAFIFLFMVFFSLGWTPLQGLYPSEVLSYENRAKGLALQSLATQAVSCINTFGLPSALAALKYKTYFIFGAFDFIGIFVIYFAAVETKQLALEQIDEVFTHSNPRAYSLQLVKERRREAREAKEAMEARA
jgi:sugar porter (SP) family MFS transporter